MIIMQRMLTVWLLLGIHAVQAEGTGAPGLDPSDTYYITQQDGLVANIPADDAPAILQHVRTFRSQLESRRARCAEDVESTRFKTHDTLITIVMPGGLLYAVGKQQRHSEAKQEYALVSQQLDDLKLDLARLKASTSEQAFALLD